MIQATEIAGDVMSAATFLGGLLLVFVGATATAFDSYDSVAKSSVLSTYKRRGWFALAGFLLALASASLAFFGKWYESSCLIIWASVCLGVSFVAVVIAAISTVLDIRKP